MRRFGWYVGAVIGLVVSYVFIVATSPVWALGVVYKQWKNMDVENVYFVDFKRGT